MQDLDRHVLFVDNLTAQQTDDFKKSISDLKGVVWYGLKNATDLWQVVDAGIAQTLKVLAGHNYQKWLDEGDNVDSWFGHENMQCRGEFSLLNGLGKHGKHCVVPNMTI